MLKFFSILALLLFIPLVPVFAAQEEENWIYLFHLEYKQGVLATEEGAKYLYDPIPTLYTQGEDPSTTDFYGIITSVRGRELARFGFNAPKTAVAALGKSVFTVPAPLFANAQYVNFYTKAGKKLFGINVSGSSFCNDDNKCNSDVGENYRNCSNDCPVPAGVTWPATPPTSENLPQETVTPPSTVTASDIPSVSTTAPRNTNVGEPITAQTNTSRIVIFVIGILSLLLGLVLWYWRKK